MDHPDDEFVRMAGWQDGRMTSPGMSRTGRRLKAASGLPNDEATRTKVEKWPQLKWKQNLGVVDIPQLVGRV